jgi:hypothetical protein
LELLRQPFASQPSKTPEQEKYVILEWDDGWREVIQVSAACADINRYYVISRPEDVGRLSLNKEDGYPELIEIVRKPLDLKRITFLNTFQLSLPFNSLWSDPTRRARKSIIFSRYLRQAMPSLRRWRPLRKPWKRRAWTSKSCSLRIPIS